MAYATTTQLAQAINMVGQIPKRPEANTAPTYEEVGTGDGSALVFYLAHSNVLASSYTLYYGASASSVTALTETTHYALDKDLGKITLTSAGRTLLSTDKIFSEYKYVTESLPDSFLSSVLDRASKEVDNAVNSTFIETTGVTNPAYTSVTEYQDSKGAFDRRYSFYKKPIINASTTLAEELDASETSIDLTSAATFPTAGYIVVDTEIIQYTGISTNTLTGCTRGALGSTAATHANAAEVNSTVVQISGTMEGGTIVWSTMAHHVDIEVDTSRDTMYIYRNQLDTNQVLADATLLAYPDVPRRVRLIYFHGYNTIPYDIVRLTLLFAKRQLMQDNISSSIVKGRNEFKPEMFNADREEMQQIINHYIVLPMENT